MQESTQVLILGGSNFMGKELVDYLSQHIANVEIHLINRGKKYWYYILDIGITMYIRTILILNTSMEIATNTSKWIRPSTTWMKSLVSLLIGHGQQSLTSPHINGGTYKVSPKPCPTRPSSTCSSQLTPFTTILLSQGVPSDRTSISCRKCTSSRRGPKSGTSTAMYIWIYAG